MRFGVARDPAEWQKRLDTSRSGEHAMRKKALACQQSAAGPLIQSDSTESSRWCGGVDDRLKTKQAISHEAHAKDSPPSFAKVGANIPAK